MSGLMHREIPAATLSDPRWSPAGLQLFAFLLEKRDLKTGELRIHGHWYSQGELLRMMRKKFGANRISESTFRRLLRNELIPFGYVEEIRRDDKSGRPRREHVDKSGRKRMVLGACWYRVFLTSKKPDAERKSPWRKRGRPPKNKDLPKAEENRPVEESGQNARSLDDSSSGQINSVLETTQNKRDENSSTGNPSSLLELPINTSSNSPSSVAAVSVPVPKGAEPFFYETPSRTALENRGRSNKKEYLLEKKESEPTKPLSFDDAFPDFSKAPRYAKGLFFRMHANAYGWNADDRSGEYWLARFLFEEFGSSAIANYDEAMFREALQRIAKGPRVH